MFIELTDHLRCPAPHDEAYLVLLPGAIESRSVRAGTLGCPVCGAEFTLRDGAFDAGDAAADGAATPDLPVEGLVAFMGLGGPGGYAVLSGPVARRWREVQAALPGVGLVAWNPPADVADEPGLSVLRGRMLALKRNVARSVVLSGAAAGPDGVREALRVTLPGRHLVGEGGAPAVAGLTVAAEGGGWWVGRKDGAGTATTKADG